jgi:hypothetical protein
LKRRSIAIFIILALLTILAILLFARSDSSSRQGKLYPYEPEKIERVDFITPQRRARIEFENDDWMLVAPVRDFTDRELMLRIFGVLKSESWPLARACVSRSELGRYGLDEPELELRLCRGGETDTLRFGSLDPETQKLWSSASWTDSLLLVPTIVRTHFLRNRYDLSDKRPIRLRRSVDARSIQVENDQGSFVLSRNDFGWEIVATATFRAEAEKVRELLRQVSGAAILDFLDGEGRQPVEVLPRGPRARLEVHVVDEIEPRVLEIGRSFHELYLCTTQDRQNPFLIDSLTCAPLFQALTAFLPQKLFEILPGRVEKISSADRRLEVAKGNVKTWVDQEGNAPSLREISRLIAFISDISTERVEALIPRQDQLHHWGLDSPETTITFRERERDLRLDIGPVIDGRRYFRRGDYPPVYSLPSEDLEFRWPGDKEFKLDD